MEQSQNSQGSSRMDISQISQLEKGKNKRFWTKKEEWALIYGLLKLSIVPQWKAEGNFNGGYLVKLEEMMNAKYPGSGKIFGADRATGASCEAYIEVVDNLYNDNEAINLDKDSEDEEKGEDESVQSAQPSPQLSKRTRKEKTPMGKGKKRMSEVIDLTSTFTNISSNIFGFMSGMNSHLETIASAFTTTQQREQVIMARELHLDQKQNELNEKKKGLFNEVIRIPKLTRVEAMMAVRKLVSDESSLTIFYKCPDDEWKKDFIINLIHPDLPPSNYS
ncbi:hypothetical protein Cgig2_006463 [Carnegiea gigantea]|uniref:Myb/SANT-like domain-containing protein n=1 Tax=Carnegiea gigantea TaxID=171969 RepID=A0A9Q1JRP5_9CARY|nr:hypothetical protein Cgig2_006463 [Carnegiea gigantea]